MARNRLLILGILLLSMGALTIGQVGELKGDQGSAGLNTTFKPNQTWRGCLIQQPIEVDFEIISHDTRNRIINYTMAVSFARKCKTSIGRGENRTIQFIYGSKESPRDALANSIREKYQSVLDENTKKTIKEAKDRGKYGS